jgi:putative membrane protein
MFYENYYWGMNFVWWIVWLGLLIWIFAIPYDIPFQRRRRDSPLDVLQKRYAAGQISSDEYAQGRKMLKNDLAGLR